MDAILLFILFLMVYAYLFLDAPTVPATPAAEPEVHKLEEQTAEQPATADPWTLPVEPTVSKPVLTLVPAIKPVLALPGTANRVKAEPVALQDLDTEELRRLCAKAGIKWRNVRGKKHLSKPEMVRLLSQRQAA